MCEQPGCSRTLPLEIRECVGVSSCVTVVGVLLAVQGLPRCPPVTLGCHGWPHGSPDLVGGPTDKGWGRAGELPPRATAGKWQDSEDLGMPKRNSHGR